MNYPIILARNLTKNPVSTNDRKRMYAGMKIRHKFPSYGLSIWRNNIMEIFVNSIFYVD